ncbi:phosphoribosyltransferase [Candidatus Beckwithbacteria bacterium CG10_big_fil_rev_8_21_14_0_10_34_10]|uniref:Phosphoribosyltransferase n=1 Tax=Candidatus Beckwithbacteria bacterium CG10_big_fil_rev_8_21_14_0_10_34_10 TaxID=1974495 RepID=A0A2H0W882_9BACT|nr:MAG: phosphoribosyltransferase [Candidatus Beckwithbacteria bacterium CG10_big_fil_rev_8_21_14_0_10_34_10]
MFKNRTEASKKIAAKLLEKLDLKENLVVLGIPRGGVLVASIVSQFLNCSFDVIVTKKIPSPKSLELAIGALGETKGSLYLNKDLINKLKVNQNYLNTKIEELKEEIKRREKSFRQNKKPLVLKGKTVIITDDGAATGATMIAAVREVWNNEPKKVIIALPVLTKETLLDLEKEADEVIFLKAPKHFFAVGQFYEEFEQVSDKKVIGLLKE